MNDVRRICVVTGSRADYGLLRPLLAAIRDAPDMQLQVVATGMHLAAEFGCTVQAIEADGFPIDARVDSLLAGDGPAAVAKSVGLGIIGFADALQRLAPGLLLVLGDRFEILAAVQAALFARIPVAHIAGGDLTEGAVDDAIRHSITKMSHLHLVTHAEARARVIQLGEAPQRVFLVGSPGLDNLRQTPLLDREALAAALGFRLRPRNLLVTFHPPTLDSRPPAEQLEELLAALDALGDEVGVIFTQANADAGGRGLQARIEAYVAGHGNSVLFGTLGELYYSAVAAVDAVVGNSSSGLYEVPSLGTATVNIGDRQKGRPRADSVIDCPAEREAILAAIRQAFSLDCRNAVNPYGDGHAVERIMEVLRGCGDFAALTQKRFHDLEVHHGI
ncbi:UDP-N-acetylglucosamine 2-epimerase [Thiohalobacter sp. IOR34]|uniref:UDP-N-acetylglucosamine 2-epimerase n=1 Tax=Thiohalobacter sp. IOR34 TaxID=3057176 RepID=UPI0025B01837|nr:UDP-N-acetylglucosamine 2-epimerase [Thiohalobacter sp. IOR34]WJW74589.1 UDP-N-acetylglucosamine 2-epimerase [Thiohalobacter sp. IOR34]